MVKRVLVALMSGLLLVSIGAVAFAAEEAQPKKVVVLPVELKDPMIAQTLALYPVFGPLATARYVGTNRLSIKVDPEIAARATRDALINVGTLLGGLLLTLESPLLGSLVFVLGPFIENYFFSFYYVEKAIEFNKKQYERFQWAPPTSSYNKKDEIKVTLLQIKF